MPVKILLADKSITIQKVVEMLFPEEEYAVFCVSDGKTALNEASRVSPDVVLADIDLPGIDGYSFAARLKQSPQFAKTPVILMMSRADVYDGAKGKQAGIIDYIAKPFESRELIIKVKKALAAAPPRAAVPSPSPARQTTVPPPVRPASPAPRKTTPSRQKRPSSVSLKNYDIALSFAGEDRDYVERVATLLREVSINVFYDKFETANLWGRNLADHLGEIYGKRSRFVVMFISKYCPTKSWPTHERQNAQARAIQENKVVLLPVRFDDTEIPGLPSTTGYIDLRQTTPKELVKLIQEKLKEHS
jgi:DNA-binding response OmpR family regulator